MAWNIKSPRDSTFDGGLTATTRDAIWLERQMQFTNGTGDDVLDSVSEALQLADQVSWECAVFSDPLELLLRAEDEEDEDAL